MAEHGLVVRDTVRIDAAVPVVWTILTDFSTWPSWNRFLPRLSMREPLRPRARMAYQVRLLGISLWVPGRWTAIEPSSRLSWRGPRPKALGVLLAGRHEIELGPAGADRVWVAHEERFEGGLARPALWLLRPRLERAGAEMLRDLKRRVEGRLLCPETKASQAPSESRGEEGR